MSSCEWSAAAAPEDEDDGGLPGLPANYSAHSSTSSWPAAVARWTHFAHRYREDAREESSRLASLTSLQHTFHRLTRHCRVLHGWRQFLALDELAWIERNEAWQTASEARTISEFGPAGIWAEFLRFLRAHPRVLALLALPPSGRAAKVQSMLGYSLANEKACLGELITFNLYGDIASEREFESFRHLLRCMLRLEVESLRAGGADTTMRDFWRVLRTHAYAPVDRDAHGRTAAASLALSVRTGGTSLSPPFTPGSSNSSSRSSSFSLSQQFHSRPLRMILLELMLRRSTAGGAFLATVLEHPLRSLLQEEKRNLDPMESVVIQQLTAAQTAHTQQAGTSAATASMQVAQGASSPNGGDTSPIGFFSQWRRNATTTLTPAVTKAMDPGPTLPASLQTPLMLSPEKVKQAVRVTEQLLCAAVDTLLDALLQASPRWPLQVKQILGDMLRCSQDMWVRAEQSHHSKSPRAEDELHRGGGIARHASPTIPEESSTAASSIDHSPEGDAGTTAEGAMFIEDPLALARTVSPTPVTPIETDALPNIDPSAPLRYTRTRSQTAVPPTPLPQPVTPFDLAAPLTHLLFGLLVLPALQQPNLSGLYVGTTLRSRARLNLRVICVVLEQVLVGEPFPPSNHLSCVNAYVMSKAASVRAQMEKLAEHCIKLSMEKMDGTIDDEERSTQRTNDQSTDAAILLTPTEEECRARRASRPSIGGDQSHHAPGAATSKDGPQANGHSAPNSPATASAAASAPLLIPHRPSICITLGELSTLHQAIFRVTERLASGSDSDRLLWDQLARFKDLPHNGPEPEGASQVMEIDITGARATATDATNPTPVYPRLAPLAKSFDTFVRHHPPTTQADGGIESTLVCLLTHTFLSLPHDALRSYAGRPTDLMSLLTHARHAIEARLEDDWESHALSLAYISECESELKRVTQAHFTHSPPQTQATSSRRSSFGSHLYAPPPPPFLLPADLNRRLFARLSSLWCSFESVHDAAQRADHLAMVHTTHLFRRSLTTLRCEHRFLRDLTFANKMLIFARQKRNVAQNMHLARLKITLPASFGPPPAQAVERRDPGTNSSSGGASISSATAPSVLTCTSLEGFISSFEWWGSSFANDLPFSARVIHSVLTALERAVREDVALNTPEVARSPSQPAGADDATPTTHARHAQTLASEFIDEPLHGESLVSRACVLLEHTLCTRLYPLIFPSDRSAASFDDEVFLWKLKGLSWLQPSHVHLPSVSSDDVCWRRPLQVMRELDHAHSPSAKIDCLTRALKWLSKLLGVKAEFSHVDADSTLSALIFLIVRSQPARMQSNLLFIETFLSPNRISGEQAYVITQWRLAAQYIEDTLSVYDQTSLEREMDAQRAEEERRRRSANGVAAAAVVAPTSDVAGAPSTMQQSEPQPGDLTVVVSPDPSLIPPQDSSPPPSRARRETMVASPPLPAALTARRLSALSPSDILSSGINFGAVSPRSPALTITIDESPPCINPVSLLAVSLRGRRSRAAITVDTDGSNAMTRVFRSPALFHAVLAFLPIKNTALVSAVSTAWCVHATHATRRASVHVASEYALLEFRSPESM